MVFVQRARIALFIFDAHKQGSGFMAYDFVLCFLVTGGPHANAALYYSSNYES